LADSIVVIGGSAVFAAFSGDVDQRYVHLVRPLLLSFGSLLSFCLTFALAQNLFYQVACGEALKIEEGKPLPVIKDRSTRTLKLSALGIKNRGELIKRLAS